MTKLTTRPFRRVLIANRGEIARRVQRTCAALGYETVAVFSDADAGAPFVREADLAVRIGPAPASESYLRVPALLDALRASGADAVHPGYGFLAENAAFAAAVIEAGAVWIGPSPEAIEAMGSKQRAKAIAVEAGVPVIPGYHGAQADDATLTREAEAIGAPLLVKASAGGGGKGMRVVSDLSTLSEALAGARREALSAFGDDTLLLERYVPEARHIEVQVLADAHGNVVSLGERECTLQRRHQKVIEEAPSPVVDAEQRAALGEAAVRLARAIGYVGAGTVEFLWAPDGTFTFLEMNTRLQVEHPVTELVTGLDLVAEQLRVASGERLRFTETPPLQGAAIEARLYAEDPAEGFLPSTGTLFAWQPRPAPHVRVDTGVEQGSEVSIHYDPMLAKVIAWGEDRADATRRLRRALRGLFVAGVTTNTAYLTRILDSERFARANFHTRLLDDESAWRETPSEPERDARAALAAALVWFERQRCARDHAPGVRPWRHAAECAAYVSPSGPIRVEALPEGPGRYSVAVTRAEAADALPRALDPERSFAPVQIDRVGEGWRVHHLDGVARTHRVAAAGDRVAVRCEDGVTLVAQVPRFPAAEADTEPGGCLSPMPGKIAAIHVEEGQPVARGEALLVLEAMKMEHTVVAPQDGVVTSLRVQVGEQVDADAVLAVIGEA